LVDGRLVRVRVRVRVGVRIRVRARVRARAESMSTLAAAKECGVASEARARLSHWRTSGFQQRWMILIASRRTW
jgi:hypothetical protein